MATRLLGASSSYSPKCLEGGRSRKPHSPGPTPTSVPDSDRLPSGTATLPTELALPYGCWTERTPGRTHAAFPEAHNTLRETLYMSTLPHPATIPFDSPLVSPAQEWLDLLKGFVGRVYDCDPTHPPVDRMRHDPIPLTEVMPSLDHPASCRSRRHCTEPISKRDLRNANIQSVVAGTYSGGGVVSTISLLKGEEVGALRKLAVRVIEE